MEIAEKLNHITRLTQKFDALQERVTAHAQHELRTCMSGHYVRDRLKVFDKLNRRSKWLLEAYRHEIEKLEGKTYVVCLEGGFLIENGKHYYSPTQAKKAIDKHIKMFLGDAKTDYELLLKRLTIKQIGE